MQTNVPVQISRAARNVTLRHPNSIDCTVWRKKLNRENDQNEKLGHISTIGGLGVLDSEDEADYDYEEIGEAKVVFTGLFQGDMGNLNDDDNDILPGQPPLEALIECVLDPTDADYFTPDKHDMITVYPGGAAAISYEVVGNTSPTAIPPYSRKYLLNPRNDANVGM